MSAPRRSSRIAIQRVNNGMIFNNFTPNQTCLILALSHQSGWSADHIALALMKTSIMEGISRIQAKNIWSFFNNWVGKRHGNTILTSEEQTTMTAILEDAGIHLTATGNPLNMTVPPTTVIYNTTTWTPEVSDATVLKVFFGSKIIMATDQPPQEGGPGLFPKFCLAMRAKNKKELLELHATEDALMANLSPREVAIAELFGEPMKIIFKSAMKRWARAVRHKLRRSDDKLGLRAINKTEYVELIMEYAAEYDSSYKTQFGEAEITPHEPLVPGKSTTLIVESTAFAGKILLALMMCDRLELVDIMRKKRREELQFTYIDVQDIKHMGDEDCGECSVCYLPFDDDKCVPIQLVVCCFKLFCVGCMKEWLGEKIIGKGMKNVACPICRQEFSDAFEKKLCPEEKRDENGDESGEESGQEDEWEDEGQIVEEEGDTIVVAVDQPQVAEGADVVMEDVVSAPEEPTTGEVSAEGEVLNNTIEVVREILAEPTPEPIEVTPIVDAMEDVQDLSQQVGEDVPAANDIEGVQNPSQPEEPVAEEDPNRAVTPDTIANPELFLGEDAIGAHESFGSPFNSGVAVMV